MLELLVMLPVFGAMTFSSFSLVRAHRHALREGIEVPTMKPHAVIAPLDRERQKAIEIGKRELAAPTEDVWGDEYHAALVRSGMKPAYIVQGRRIIEYSYDGTQIIDRSTPDIFVYDECPCRECRTRLSLPVWEVGPLTRKALDKMRPYL